MRRRRGYRQLVESDLDIMPLMNLFVVLIPMLLLSAVFVEIHTIDMDLPGAGDTVESERESLDLAIRLEDDRYVVRGNRLRERTVDRGAPEADTQLAAVLASIREAHPDERAVRIESPDDARYQDLVHVMDVARGAGLDAIALARRADASSLKRAR